MSAAVLGLAGTIILVLGTVLGLILKQARRSPEQKTADSQVWASLSGVNTTLAAELTRVYGRIADLEAADSTRRVELAAMQEKADAGERAAREVTWLRGLLIRAVRPIVEWIDQGAHPPPPRIPHDLRTLLAEAEQHEADDPTTP